MNLTKHLTRTDVINYLIKKHNYRSYLEIGVQRGTNFKNIECLIKEGVDPDPNSKATVYTTSDVFLNGCIKMGKKWDIIFIDGLHHEEQVYRDIINSLDCLNKGGTIVCHDMFPKTKEMQMVPRVQAEWTGDCWKAWVRLRQYRMDLKMIVIDSDYGIGIIQRGSQTILKLNAGSIYENFSKDAKRWLNAVSAEEFEIFV